VKKLLVLGAGACGAAAVALTLVGGGVANADDQVVGQTYKDAKAAIGQMGLTPAVATTIGGRKDWDNCIVTSANKAPFLDGSGRKVGTQMLVNLNCYAK
jgi:O-acetyl-ADP-ribose deacetylase (regulator of RNase III)